MIFHYFPKTLKDCKTALNIQQQNRAAVAHIGEVTPRLRQHPIECILGQGHKVQLHQHCPNIRPPEFSTAQGWILTNALMTQQNQQMSAVPFGCSVSGDTARSSKSRPEQTRNKELEAT